MSQVFYFNVLKNKYRIILCDIEESDMMYTFHNQKTYTYTLQHSIDFQNL